MLRRSGAPGLSDAHVGQALHHAAQGTCKGGVTGLELFGHQVDAVHQAWVFINLQIRGFIQQSCLKAGCQRLQGFVLFAAKRRVALIQCLLQRLQLRLQTI